MDINDRISPRVEKFLTVSERRGSAVKSGAKTANQMKAFFELYQNEPRWRRHALTFSYMLNHEPVVIGDEELLVGQIYLAPWDYQAVNPEWPKHDLWAIYADRVAKELPEIFQMTGGPMGVGLGHIGWHWDWIVQAGIEGLFQRIDAALPQVDAKGREQLEGMRMSLQAVLDWNDAHLRALEARLPSVSGAERDEVEEKIAICRRVPRQGARNFREAVQAFHFSFWATMYENPFGGNSPGRLDYFLWPYLEKDLRDGVETMESARDLVDELFIRFHESLLWDNDGGVQTIVVGGCHPDGSCSASPLTKLMVESIISLKRLTHPSVYVRVPPNAPEWLLDLSAQYLLKGGNRAQILNDAAIIKAMTADGHIETQDARMYMCGGCMELSPFGMNGDLLFTGFFNVAKILEYVLAGGECLLGGKKYFRPLAQGLEGYASFEELYSTFVAELDYCLTLSFKRLDIWGEEHPRHRPAFLQSSQVEDCVARGRLINDGGALYEDYGSTPLGIPNCADSLTAIKRLVFEEKSLGAAELLAALRANFAGNETLRLKLRAQPKFGQGAPAADAMMARLCADVCAIYEKHSNRLGGKMKPMIMTFMMAAPMGAELGAAADGRLSGTPIAQGITPQSCGMGKGVTTALLSATAVALLRFSGGASHIWDIDPAFAPQEVVRGLMNVFFQAGGQMFQGNVTDVEKLKQAQKEPEAHSGLTVRVGGYSGTFVKLTRPIQDEVINRHRHNG